MNGKIINEAVFGVIKMRLKGLPKSMVKTLIKNATIVNENTTFKSDVLIDRRII